MLITHSSTVSSKAASLSAMESRQAGGDPVILRSLRPLDQRCYINRTSTRLFFLVLDFSSQFHQSRMQKKNAETWGFALFTHPSFLLKLF